MPEPKTDQPFGDDGFEPSRKARVVRYSRKCAVPRSHWSIRGYVG